MFRLFSQQQQNEEGDTETRMPARLAPPGTEVQNLHDVQEEETNVEHVNGKVIKSNSEAHLNSSSHPGVWLRPDFVRVNLPLLGLLGLYQALIWLDQDI